MTAVMLIGDVDLTDRTAYHFSQSDDGDVWEETTSPRRNSPTADTLIVSRSEKTADILTFFVVCVGDDADACESNYQALRDELEEARTYWITRGGSGAIKTVQKGVDGQSAPLVWTIKTYRLRRTNHAWDGIPMIGCQLVMTVVEGTVTAAVASPPAPTGLRILLPAPSVVTGVNPTALALPLAFPTPTLAVEAVPSPLALPVVLPTPTLEVEVTPDPLALTLALPAPTLTGIAAPDPMALAMEFPDPTLTIGTPPSTPLAMTVVLPTPTLSLAVAPDPLALPLVLPDPTAETSDDAWVVVLTGV